MRYYHIVPTTKETSNAVVFCIMDTSGSMGTVKKYLARSFYFLLYQFVRQKYQNVEVVFRPFLERNVDRAVNDRINSTLNKNKPKTKPIFALKVCIFIISSLF